MSEIDAKNIILINFLLMALWHLSILFLCMKLDSSFFDPRKFLYTARKWEKKGKFYTSVLKIKKWKDKLPQYVCKNGFSKRSLNSKMDKQYMEKFIVETCRAEWNHFMCSMYWVVSIFLNSSIYAVIFSLIPILANLPFLLIQRFNRIRLCRLIKHSCHNQSVLQDTRMT